MLHPLVSAAISAVSNPAFTAILNQCQKWVRQVYERVYGKRFDAFRAATAHLAHLKWKKSKYWLPPTTPLQPGDIVYFGPTITNPFGHVGIYIGDGKIAHNSSLCRGQKYQWKGYTLLQNMRKIAGIVRLPKE